MILWQTWADWRSSVKAKALRLQKYQKETGGGGVPNERLSPLEERLLASIGRVSTFGDPSCYESPVEVF